MELISVIYDTDLTRELPQLKGAGWKVIGTAEESSLTIMKDSELGEYGDNYFKGGTIYNIDQDELREIVGSNQTGEVCFRSFSSKNPEKFKYILTRSFTKEIARALEIINETLNALGNRENLIVDPYDFQEAHIYMSIAEICKGLSTEESGFWYKMWKEYQERAKALFTLMDFKYSNPQEELGDDGE